MGYDPGEGLEIEKLRLEGSKGARLKSASEIAASGAKLGSSIITAIIGIGILYFLVGIVGIKIFSAVNIWLFLGIIFVLILLWKWR